jgi:hypothetical protein
VVNACVLSWLALAIVPQFGRCDDIKAVAVCGPCADWAAL